MIITSILLLMAEILHQLIGTVVFPFIYSVSYIPGGAGFQPSTVCQELTKQWLWWVTVGQICWKPMKVGPWEGWICLKVRV